MTNFQFFHSRNPATARALVRRRALILGAGAQGSQGSGLLASQGMGAVFIDHDVLELANLHRHYLKEARYLGWPKASAIADRLAADFPREQLFRALDVDIRRVGDEELCSLIGAVDVCIGATGDPEVDRRLNRLCRETATPFIVPGLWPAHPSVIGDIFFCPWSVRSEIRAPIGCYTCANENGSREDAEPLESQPGSASDVLAVAIQTAKLATGLFLPSEHPDAVEVRNDLAAGINHYRVERGRIVKGRIALSRDCPECRSAGVIRRPAISIAATASANSLQQALSDAWPSIRIIGALVGISAFAMTVDEIADLISRLFRW